MTDFIPMNPDDFVINPFRAMLKDWMLLTAGTLQDHNAMTIAWGAYGGMWNKKIVLTAVRPTRHTYRFTEEMATFTVAFLPENKREALTICGTRSGRDGDKIKAAGLTPRAFGDNLVSFAEASLVIACRKIYFQDLDPRNFLADDIAGHYDNDYHRLYMGEVLAIHQRKP